MERNDWGTERAAYARQGAAAQCQFTAGMLVTGSSARGDGSRIRRCRREKNDGMRQITGDLRHAGLPFFEVTLDLR